MARLKRLDAFDKPRLWQRLQTYAGDEAYTGDKTALAHLIASTRKVTEQAAFIGRQIVRYLPQYTLHDERHYLNVLAIMDALIPDNALENMTPLECALCIMTAYTHDLGMALQEDEHRKMFDEGDDTPERKRFLRYRDGFSEELRQIERLKKRGDEEAKRRSELIEGHILASYIRETHADETVGRIKRWLDAIVQEARDENLLRYGTYDFKHELALIGISHGKSARWLRDQLTRGRGENGFYRLVGTGEWANFAFAGLLLRLADIMDFDASRTPRILFKHIGIENETSILEWRKHMSINGWDLRPGEKTPRLRYAASCEHPVHEKSIRMFASWIDGELSAARAELDAQRRQLDEVDRERFDLYLPTKVELDVHPVGHPHDPVYIYQDIEFQLDQDEIQQLLLGESLWGDPALCIRELLQNALDALHMRELRLQLQEKEGQSYEPVDPLKPVKGQKETLQVILSWGHDEDSGQDYIQVEDNGIGMTEEAIKRYFTQIGKSYYRSPDFARERAAMTASGFLATPISYFGIGILSCFMIADRLQVRTHPGGLSDERRAYDITISGPGSLFWLRPGTRERQGTAIKLFLKRNYTIDTEYEALPPAQKDKHIINPISFAASRVVWPLYPIIVRPPEQEPVVIDSCFHRYEPKPLDKAKILEVAAKWECPASFIGEPEWGFWDWADPITGSRGRLWFPRNYRPLTGSKLPIDPPEEEGLCRQDELSAFVEEHLYEDFRTDVRTGVSVNGMFVWDLVCKEELGVGHGVGTKAWVDLRGAAAPRLTVDRDRTLEPEEPAHWRDTVHGVFQRMAESIRLELQGLQQDAVKNLLSAYVSHESLQPEVKNDAVPGVYDFARSSAPTWSASAARSLTLDWLTMRLITEAVSTFDLDRDFVLARTINRAPIPDGNLKLASDSTRHLFDARSFARDLASDLDLDFDLDLDHNLELDLARDLTELEPAFHHWVHASLLQEAFWPDLSRSFPMLGLFHLRGKLGNAMLVGPGLVEFELESDQRTVYPVDLEGKRPEALIKLGYDLALSMSAIPLGELRRQCPEWRLDRRLRPLGTLPFLEPSSGQHLSKHAEGLSRTFGVTRLYALLPRIELWSKPFDQWTDDDWRTCGLSALWEFGSGQVLWAKGAHHVDDMSNVGLPVDEFLKAHRDSTG